MPQLILEGVGCVRADQEEGEVSLLRWDVKWRSRAAMGMKVSLAPFLSTGVCVLLPCSLSSLDRKSVV